MSSNYNEKDSDTWETHIHIAPHQDPYKDLMEDLILLMNTVLEKPVEVKPVIDSLIVKYKLEVD